MHVVAADEVDADGEAAVDEDCYGEQRHGGRVMPTTVVVVETKDD